MYLDQDKRRAERALHDLVRRRKMVDKLGRMTAALDAMPRWHLQARRDQAAATASLRASIDNLQRNQPSTEWLLSELHRRIALEVRNIRRRNGHSHPFRADILDDAGLPAEVIAGTLEHTIDTPLTGRVRRPEKVSDVPELAELLTAGAVADVISDRVAHYAAIAADNTFLARDASYTSVTEHPNGTTVHRHEKMTIVEHRASGLRGAFTIAADGGFGMALTKSYRVDAIQLQHAAVDWSDVTGLGIGRRVYLAAAAIHPHVRWRDDAGESPTGRGVRKALHLIDPWRWQNKACTTCRGTDLEHWHNATSDAFAMHPLDPAPQPPDIEWC